MGVFGLVGASPSIARRAAQAAAALIILSAGVVFTIRASDNSDSPVMRCQTASGSQTCILTGSGAGSFSGALTSSGVTLSSNVSGFSGGSMSLTRSGGIIIPDSDGGGCIRIRGSTTAGITGEAIDCPTPGNF